MRHFTISLAATVLLGAPCFGQAGLDATNVSVSPVPPHWYQTVNSGVTLRHLSPVEYFRGLLGMTPQERQRVLADKSPAARMAILSKAMEYEALPREIREERLHQTELHWHLLNLIQMDPSARAAELQQISPVDQPMVLGPLAQWDELPAADRKALLDKQDFIRTYLEWAARSPAGQQEMLDQLPAPRRARWTQEWQRWQALTEDQRQGMCDQFRQFFMLTAPQQRRTISVLSDAEREDMAEALRAYDQLPPAERQVCINSFRKFATMTAAERNQFLSNAQRWEAMTAYERQVWRELVEKLPPMPPMPPGFPGYPTKAPPPAPTVTALAAPSR
jgi:hypothetical protein